VSILHEALQKRKHKEAAKAPLGPLPDSRMTQRRRWILISASGAAATAILAGFFFYGVWKEFRAPRLTMDLTTPLPQVTPLKEPKEVPAGNQEAPAGNTSRIEEKREVLEKDGPKNSETGLSASGTTISPQKTPSPIESKLPVREKLESTRSTKPQTDSTNSKIPKETTDQSPTGAMVESSHGPGAGSEQGPAHPDSLTTSSAVEIPEKTVRETPDLDKTPATEAFLEVAHRYLKENRPDMALAIYDQIARSDTENLDAALGQAVASGMSGDWALCKKRLEALSLKHPENPNVWLNLGMAFLRLSQTDEALGALERAEGCGANRFWVLFYRAGALRIKGDLEGALSAYQLAHEMQPDHLELTWNLALALDKAGRYREAASQYQALLSKSELSQTDRMALRQRLEQLESITFFQSGEKKGLPEESMKR